MLLSVTLSCCVCVRRGAYIAYIACQLHAALVSVAKVMRCIQCCLVALLLKKFTTAVIQFMSIMCLVYVRIFAL